MMMEDWGRTIASVHINQVAHIPFHDDESYCIQTWKTAGDPPLYHYNWSTADDKSKFSLNTRFSPTIADLD